MEKKDNINIAEKLKGYPNGLKLYSPLFGNVELCVSKSDGIAVFSKSDNGDNIFNTFTENGLFYSGYSQSQCLLFPSSEMRDWSKFFKRGDVVRSKDNMYAIFEGWANDDYTKFNTKINFYAFDASFNEEAVCGTERFVKASDEERMIFIANIEKHYKGKYNPKTLQVEPVKPECPFKPFDKVLVRDGIDEQWRIHIFSHHQNGDFSYVCLTGAYRYCIPYNEDTAQLLNTTDPYTEGGSE